MMFEQRRTTFDMERVNEWHGQDVVDPEGHRVGRLEEIYSDNYGDSPGFACVKTGLFGRRLTFVPLDGASLERDHVRVAYLVDQIKHAPNVEPDGVLSTTEEAALFGHYGLDSGVNSASLPGAQPTAAPSLQSPRLMRQHSEAAAAHLTEMRQLAAADIVEARQFAADRGEPGEYAVGGGVNEARLNALEARITALENHLA